MKATEAGKLPLFTHKKSHRVFPLVPNMVTLNDLERRKFAMNIGTEGADL